MANDPLSRRRLLQKAAVGTTIAWTVPVIASAATPVAAATGSQCTVSMGGWNSFSFGPVGSTTTITRTYGSGGGALDVTDAYLTGDQFDVSVAGNLCGQTSNAPNLGRFVWTNNPNTAYTDARWSSARVYLGPGTHTISITVTVSPWGSGGGFWRDGDCV
ncbi:MAG: hypothetical protein ACR2QE_01315 [Acidimicrobiales bacterium]